MPMARRKTRERGRRFRAESAPRGVGSGWGVSEAREAFVTSLPRMSGAALELRGVQSSISDIGEAEPDWWTTGWLTVYAKDDSHFKVRAEEIWKDRDE